MIKGSRRKAKPSAFFDFIVPATTNKIVLKKPTPRKPPSTRSGDPFTKSQHCILILLFTLTLTFAGADKVAAVNTGCVGGDCTDVPSDGIRYTSGTVTVSVGDGTSGTTTVDDLISGIELTQFGATGASAAVATFEELEDYDIDPTAGETLVDVVTSDGTNPLLIDGNFVITDGADSPTYTVGADSYTGLQLAELLTTQTDDAGGTITGSLTVNNNTGPVPSDAGAPFITKDAPGIFTKSTGGNGGNGGCSTILFYTWCDNGDRGGNAGSVVVNSNSMIKVTGDTAEGKHGILAISQGGEGGDGGGAFGLFASDAGAGGDGGNGNTVFVTLGADSAISTEGAKSHGVSARSRGGDGGSGGDPSSIAALGSAGGNGGDAGNVLVDNDGSILANGRNSHGIFAQSVGAGAGSGSDSGGIYAEGGNGGGESNGAKVNINNSGSITTKKADSFGVIAQSIGGGGGDGGDAGGWFTVGGRGGSGGGSDVVSVYDSGTVNTSGDRSTAIFAQSIGGGGGNGGDAVSIAPTLSIAVGGDGGLGGAGHEVHVTTAGSDIDTGGDNAHGIHAQSIGGGGGNGGMAVSGNLGGSAVNVSVALGGDGGGGGDAGDSVEVITSSDTAIDTIGSSSYGISAQSIGGGGGNGGSAFSGAGGGSIGLAIAIGGKGGVAGAGKSVTVENAGAVKTGGDLSTGIAAQSIGGGGGNGGFAGTLAIGAVSASVGVGGDGGGGGAAGQVDISNSGTVETGGENAIGVFAQSVGGGGGNGGSALSGSAGILSVGTTVAGGGGSGNNGGLVNVINAGLIDTTGNNSTGIFAQSVGGGGGNGGNATSGSIAGGAAIGVAVGGNGGIGGDGGNVEVTNESTGSIQTAGINSDGVFAQSIAGSGGTGGSATTATLAFPVEIEGVEIPAIAINVAIGGNGGGGGEAGLVDVDNYGDIITTGFMANGVFAQSVGGSGGRGGNTTNIQIAFDALVTGSVGIGGSGGNGGSGKKVTVDNYNLIHTVGKYSNGILAQSIGGGGGFGGDATNFSLSLTPPPTAPEDFIPTPSMSFDLAIGGDGGAGAVGGEVEVTNSGEIITEGSFAPGIMAQSVGGAGGAGGDAKTIQVELTADPMDFLPLTDLMGLDVTMVFGGTGGDGSHGGNVMVTNENNVSTTGAFSHGIVAQSVGGGGGSGGSAMTFEFSNTDIVPDIPVLDDISGLTTIEMTLQGSGGAGGDGGNVTLSSDGNIRTDGDFAMGVVAQSIAGGGGLAGFFNPHGIINNEIGDALFNTFVDTEAGLSFAGSVGGAGTAGNVIANHTGNIQTQGDGAHGLFAQSAAAQGAAGTIDITLSGTINALGDYAHGIYAQSGGGSGNGDITVTINDGVVMGGSAMGAGVFIAAGANNELLNQGTITSVPGVYGQAIVTTSGSEQIENYGTITGNVFLGGGSNSFNNKREATFNSGAAVDLGTSNLFTNDGTLSPGGSGNILTSALTGDLRQTSSGVIALDIDGSNGAGDRLDVSGTADLAGTAELQIINAGRAVPGSYQTLILTGADGTTDSGLSLAYQPSTVLSYQLLYPNTTDVVLSTRIDFSPMNKNLTPNQGSLGKAINRIQQAGGTDSFAPVVAELIQLPNATAVRDAYNSMSPESHASSGATAFEASQQYAQTLVKRMHSIRSYLDTTEFAPGIEQNFPNSMWINAFGEFGDQDSEQNFTGFDYDLSGVAIGLDRLVGDGLLVGVSYGQSYTSIDLSRDKGSGSVHNYLFSIYGSLFNDRFYLDATASYGKESFKSHRWVEVGALSGTASSNHDGDLLSLYTETGYIFELSPWLPQPYAALQYSALDEDRYQESGAGGLNLIVDSRETESLISDLGLRFNRPIKTDELVYIPEISVAWRHDYEIDDGYFSAAFAGSPDVFFTTENRDADKDGVLIGIGITALNEKGISLDLRYDAEIKGDFHSQRIAGGIRYEF